MVLGSGLLQDETSTEKDSCQCCSMDGSTRAAFCTNIAVYHATMETGYVPCKATGWVLRA
jgi:hypothetical protein